MIVALLRPRRSWRDQTHDRTDRKTAPKESAAAYALADIAAARAKPRVARLHTGRRRRSLHAAALRRLRDLLLSGARCVPCVPFRRSRLRGCAAAGHAAQRNHAAYPCRRALPRARAMARRSDRLGMRTNAGNAPACRL